LNIDPINMSDWKSVTAVWRASYGTFEAAQGRKIIPFFLLYIFDRLHLSRYRES
jgi:hypothetical protein